MKMRDPSDLSKQAFEILEVIEQLKGPIHARMVMGIFSLNNIFTVAINLTSMEEAAKQVMLTSWENIMASTIYCYTHATLSQDPDWESYSKEVQNNKAYILMQSLQEDVETLDRKQREYQA